MNKTMKGAFGASAAAVLLLGGAGSLAYWTGSSTAEGGSITSGTLGIDPLNVGNTNSPCDASWVYAPGAAKAGQPVTLFVPGDKVTKKCTFTIAATGDNLSAKITAPSTLAVTSAGTTSLKIDTAASYTVAKGATSRTVAQDDLISSADNASTLTATFVATIPFGSAESGTPKVNANDTKSITATLNTLTVALTQVTPNA
jgi:alternate signal-mediated exported protein